MDQNVGVLDQTLRVGIGFGLLVAAFIAPAPLKYFAYAGALLFAVTGFSGKCLLYKALGIKTC